MSKKRLVLESIVFGMLIFFAYILFTVIQGQILTANFVPDVINNYAQQENLPSKIRFGVTERLNTWIYVSGCVLLSVLYGTIRWVLTTSRKSHK